MKVIWEEFKDEHPDFINTRELPLDIVLNTSFDYYKHQNSYEFGAFYMIKNIVNNKKYIGKSKHPINRLKSHINKSKNNKGLLIDKSMHQNLSNFRFYILFDYKTIGIDWYKRRLEGLIEQYLIKIFNSYGEHGYNEYVI